MNREQLQEMFGNGMMPSFLVENDQRRARWAHLTEGLDDYKRLALETMLDSAQMWLMTEGTTDTTNVQAFTTYGFPLIRRVLPNLIANELVSVQPIPMPTAMIFYLDFKYGKTRAGVQAGDIIGAPAAGGGYKFSPYYAGGMVRGLLLTDDADEGANTFTIATDIPGGAEMLPMDPDSVVVYKDGVIYHDFAVTNPETGAITVTIAVGQGGGAITIDYHVAGTAEGEEIISTLNLDMTSESVTAETKKLRADWTLEAQQDLFAYHGLNAESELLAVLADEIRREIDRLIINDLLRFASAGTVTWQSQMPTGYKGSEREYRTTLWDAIIDANTLIYKKRYRNATWILADPDTCSRLEKLDGFKDLTQDEWSGNAGMGVERFGIIRNRFTVYKDPWMTPNTMLLGYRGTTMFETGYIYAPYVPLYTTPVFMDPRTMKPTRSIMSRYARKPVITDFYAKVQIV